MNTSFFGELLQTIAERGRALLDRGRDRHEMRRVLGIERRYGRHEIDETSGFAALVNRGYATSLYRWQRRTS